MSDDVLHRCAAVTVRGYLSPNLSPLLDAFVENFREHGELGCTVCVYHRGVKVAELWGGYRDLAKQIPWTRDTLIVTYSAAKAPLYVLTLLLADRGALDVNACVADYWPEFAQQGKSRITLRQVLNHTAGLAAVPVPEGSATNYEFMVQALASAKPAHEPGIKPVYHSLTQGWLLSEVLSRTAGMPFTSLFEQYLQIPWSLDFHYDLSDEQSTRVADYHLDPEPGAYYEKLNEPGSIQAIALSPLGAVIDLNAPALRRCVIPAVNGHASANALARLFAPLANGGRLGDKQQFNPETLLQMVQEEWHSAEEMVVNMVFRMGLGFLLNDPPVIDFGPERSAFGALGSGGITGFADPVQGVSYGYTCNMGYSGSGTGPRNRRLTAALYACLNDNSSIGQTN